MAITYPKIILTLADDSSLTFEDTGVIKAKLIEQCDLISASLPYNKLTASLYDADGGFSVFGTENTFAERKPIEVYEYVDGVEVYIGRYYLDKPTVANEYQVDIEAFDIVGLLDTTPYDGRFYSSLTPFSVVIAAVLGDLDIEYTIDPVLSDMQIKGWIPPGSRREALQQCCFAVGAAVNTSRSSEIYIFESPLPQTNDWQDFDIGVNDKFQTQPISLEALVTGIELTAHNYEQGTESETILDETLDAGVYKIIFEKPYYDITVTGVGYVPTYLVDHDGNNIVNEDGDYIVVDGEFEFGPNYVVLHVEEPGGAVEITGHPWTDTQRVYTFTESGLSTYAHQNIKSVNGATLVSDDNAETVLARLRDYYRQRYTHDFALVPTVGTKYGAAKYGEFKYGWSAQNVNIGQVLSIDTVHDKKLRCAIEKISLDLSGGFLGSYETNGVEQN